MLKRRNQPKFAVMNTPEKMSLRFVKFGVRDDGVIIPVLRRSRDRKPDSFLSPELPDHPRNRITQLLRLITFH